jgi:DNA-binding FadR family transcriptional regulator
VTELTGEVRRVADVLLGRIMDGSYPAGLRLPAENALAEELSCGRSTVREALRHLADLGLVRSRRGSGAMVLDFRREGTPALLPHYLRAGRLDGSATTLVVEMLRLRTMMASEAVRLAARYAEPASLADARRYLAAGPALERDPAAHALNELDFYRALVVASGTWPAVWMVNSFWGPLREVNAMLAPVLGPVRPDFQRAMEAVLARVEQGDEKGAVAEVRGWFERIDGELVAAIELALGGPGEKRRS